MENKINLFLKNNISDLFVCTKRRSWKMFMETNSYLNFLITEVALQKLPIAKPSQNIGCLNIFSFTSVLLIWVSKIIFKFLLYCLPFLSEMSILFTVEQSYCTYI